MVGLGVVGQLTAQLHMLAGNRVIGWDTVPFRAEIARKWGIDAAVTVGPEDPIARTREFTGGYGLDGERSRSAAKQARPSRVSSSA